MYNLRSNKKDTIQLPVQMQIADDQFLTELLQHDSSLNDSVNMSDSVHESSDIEIDYDALINKSDDETQSTSAKSGKNNHSAQSSDTMNFSSEFKVQSVINSQILEQLQKIGKRLDKIENGDCKKSSDKSKIKGEKVFQSQRKRLQQRCTNTLINRIINS